MGHSKLKFILKLFPLLLLCLAFTGCLGRTPTRIDADGYGGNDGVVTSFRVVRNRLLRGLDQIFNSGNVASFCLNLSCNDNSVECGTLMLLDDETRLDIGEYLSDPQIQAQYIERLERTPIVISEAPLFLDGSRRDAITSISPTGPIFAYRGSFEHTTLGYQTMVAAHEIGHKLFDVTGNGRNTDEFFLDGFGACVSIATSNNPSPPPIILTTIDPVVAPTCSLDLDESTVTLSVQGDAVAAVLNGRVVHAVNGGSVALSAEGRTEGYVIDSRGNHIDCAGSPLNYTPPSSSSSSSASSAMACSGTLTVRPSSVPACMGGVGSTSTSSVRGINIGGILQDALGTVANEVNGALNTVNGALGTTPPSGGSGGNSSGGQISSPAISFTVSNLPEGERALYYIAAIVGGGCSVQSREIVVDCDNGALVLRDNRVEFTAGAHFGEVVQSLNVDAPDWSQVTLRK